MVAPPDVTPEYYQILVVRELRRVGLEVGEPSVLRRSELPEPQRGFVLELSASLARTGWRKRALIACYRQDRLVGLDVITPLSERVRAARADLGIVVATADSALEAVAEAQRAGIMLLRVVDARAAYDSSGWGGGAPGHYPSWLPAHTLHQVVRDAAGAARLRPLDAGAFATGD